MRDLFKVVLTLNHANFYYLCIVESVEENRILELNPRLLYYLGLCCFGKYWSSPYTRTCLSIQPKLNVRVTFLNNDLWGEDSLKKVKPANLSYQVWISQTQEAEVPSLRISRSFTTWVLKSEDLKKPPEISSLNISRNPSCWIPSEHLKKPRAVESQANISRNPELLNPKWTSQNHELSSLNISRKPPRYQVWISQETTKSQELWPAVLLPTPQLLPTIILPRCCLTKNPLLSSCVKIPLL